MATKSLFAKNKAVLFVITSITIGGFFFRTWHLGTQSLWIDEAYTVNGATAITEHGYPLLESGEFYPNNILTGYTTAATLETGLFDPFNPWVARLPSAFFGTLLILAVFLLAWTIFRSRHISLLAAFLTAFSYWEIAWSRQIRGYAACALLVVIAMTLLWQFMESRKTSKFIWALLLTLVASLFHFTALTLIPVFILIGIVSLRDKNKSSLFDEKKLLYGLGIVFILETLSIVIFFHTHLGWIPRLFNSVDTMFGLGVVVSIITGLSIRKYRMKVGFLSLVMAIMVASILLFSPSNQTRYVFLLMPIGIILISYGAICIGEYTSNRKICAGLTAILAVLIFYSSNIQWYPQAVYTLENDTPQPNYTETFSRIKQLQNDNETVISFYPLLHQIYLGKKGLWLALLRTNLNLFKSNNPNPSEYYVNAPAINDALQLKNVLETTHGFIIIDNGSREYLGEKMSLIYDNPKISLIYSSGDEPRTMIWVYRF